MFEALTRAHHRRDLMHQFARKANELVLLRHDDATATVAHPILAVKLAVVDAKIASSKWFRLGMKKIYEGQRAARNLWMSVITVVTEEITVIAGSDLHFATARLEGWHLQLPKYQWQHAPDPREQPFFMLPQVHQDARPPVFIVDRPTTPDSG